MVKRVKDLNTPKRPLSAYFLWANENRDSIKKANPNASITEMSKLLGDQWKGVSESDKKLFQDAFAKASATYQKEMEKYKKTPEYAAHQELVKQAKMDDSKKPFKKDANAPKRPPSGYLIWTTEVGRAKFVKSNPDASVTEVVKALAAQWKELPESEREKYNEKGAKRKAAYQKELEKYQKTDAYKQYEEEKAAYKAEQSKKRNRLDGGEEKAKKKVKKSKSPKRSSSARRKPKAAKSRSRSRRRAARKSKSRSRSSRKSAKASKK